MQALNLESALDFFLSAFKSSFKLSAFYYHGIIKEHSSEIGCNGLCKQLSVIPNKLMQ